VTNHGYTSPGDIVSQQGECIIFFKNLGALGEIKKTNLFAKANCQIAEADLLVK